MTAFGGENAESYYDEGLTASMKGDLPRAISCFERAIRMDNSMAAAYHQLGKCYYRQGNFQAAVNLLAQVVQHRPSHTAARLDYGHALLQCGRIDEARHQFQEIYVLDPSNSRGVLGLAETAFAEGDWQSAMNQAQQALTIGGANFTTLFLLGRAARLAGNLAVSNEMLKRAEKLMEKSIELNPNQPEGYYLRGEVCFAQDRYPAALEQFRAAEDRILPERVYSAYGENFSRVDALAKQGLCYQRLEQPERAREIGEKILKIVPEHKLGQSLKEL